MKWFKHDTDASIDAKLQELLLDYGASGYGLYWYCLELIAQNVNENNITFELEHDARIIARNLNLSVQETKDMMQKMIELGLFSFSKNHKLACYTLAKRIDQSMTSNPEFRVLIKNIKENKTINNSNVMINHDLVMQEENRIEENRIEENSNSVAITLCDEAKEVSEYLYKRILEHQPTFKKPNISLWTKDIDKAIRLDGRSKEHLIRCIDWIYTTDKGRFWISNILSGKKLREKFDTMKIQASQKTQIQQKTAMVDEIYSNGISAKDLIERMEQLQ